MDAEERVGYLAAMEERIVTAVREEIRAGDAALREEMRAGDAAVVEEIRRAEAALRAADEALREAVEAAYEALREELLAANRGTRVLFESLEATVRAVWAEGVPALTAERDRRMEEQREEFDSRVGTLEAVARDLAGQVRDHERRITLLERE